MSLAEDLDEPTRFSHYRPTRRAAAVLGAVLQPNAATMVIAPYGSGKSLAAGVAALAVRNDEDDRLVVASMVDAVDELAPEVGHQIRDRLDSRRSGLVVVLSGYEPDPLAVC